VVKISLFQREKVVFWRGFVSERGVSVVVVVVVVVVEEEEEEEMRRKGEEGELELGEHLGLGFIWYEFELKKF
jgi:hypothetical protein